MDVLDRDAQMRLRLRREAMDVMERQIEVDRSRGATSDNTFAFGLFGLVVVVGAVAVRRRRKAR